MYYAILTTSTKQCKIITKTEKKAIAAAYDGDIRQLKANSVTEFLSVLDGLQQTQSIILGTPHKLDGTPLDVGQKIELTTTKKPKPDAIPRTKSHLKNINREGFLLFDIDDGGTYDELLGVIPELDGVGAVVVPSSSSFINDENGKKFTGARGWHIYVHILNMEDAERIAAVLWGRMWLKTRGNIKISNGIHPAMLERGLWDKCVLGAPERLAFEAAPILHDGLTSDVTQQRRAFDGIAWDTEQVADLTATEQKQIAELIKKAKAEKEPERKKAEKEAKKIYVEKSVKPKAEALRDWEMIGRQLLPYDFILHTEAGEREAGTLGADDNGLLLADPNEPEYNGGALCAQFYWNEGKKPIIHSFAHGKHVYKIAALDEKEEWEIVLENKVAELDEKFMHGRIDGKHRVAELGEKGFVFLSKLQDVIAEYLGDDIQTEVKELKSGETKPVYENVIQAWAARTKNRFEEVIFAPLAPMGLKNKKLNRWRGFLRDPEEATTVKDIKALSLIHDHLLNVLCCGDQTSYEYLVNWIAYTFQNPEKPAETAIVLVGEQGTGKSIIGEFLLELWGVHGEKVERAKHLTGNFNNALENACFLLSEEATYHGDKEAADALKSLVTSGTIRIEPKGRDSSRRKNFLKIFMCTNHAHAINSSKDERRFFVLNVDNAKRPHEYFDKLGEAVESPSVQAAFLHKMLNLSLSGFHPKQMPETAGRKEQRLHSLCSIGQWLSHSLESGAFTAAPETGTAGLPSTQKWEGFMSTGYLFDSYIFFCNIMKKGPYERRSQRALSDYLVKCGFALARNSARTQRGFNMLDVPQASALFCEKLGIENIHTPDTYKTVSGSVSGSKALQIKGLDTSDTVDTVLK